MSLYERDYYRDNPGPGGPFGAAAGTRISATAWIVILNSCMFGFTLLLAGLRDSPMAAFVRDYLYTWPEGVLFKLWLWQLLTGTFIHADFIHILFNMLFLYMFGRELEAIIGRREFVAFYLVSAALGSLCFSVWGVLGGGNVPSVGASGAVAGVVVLYAFHRPRKIVYVWGMVPLEVRWLAALFIGLDLFFFLSSKNTGVAHCAHLGGALYGVLYRFVDLRIDRIRMLWRLPGRSQAPPPPGPPPFMPEPRGGTGGSVFENMDAVERRVDELLNKISRSGLSALTDEERTFLKEASRRYGGRRE